VSWTDLHLGKGMALQKPNMIEAGAASNSRAIFVGDSGNKAEECCRFVQFTR
jgi:hypothetical protein